MVQMKLISPEEALSFNETQIELINEELALINGIQFVDQYTAFDRLKSYKEAYEYTLLENK